MTAQDISGRKEIELLVNTFYKKVNIDIVISHMFSDVDWEAHLPVMYDFWENVIFYTGNYNGNPMSKHQDVHQKNRLTSEHFKRWLTLFTEAVDNLFEGPNAVAIKEKAQSIATILEMKIIIQGKNVM